MLVRVATGNLSSTAVYLVAAAPCNHWPNRLCILCCIQPPNALIWHGAHSQHPNLSNPVAVLMEPQNHNCIGLPHASIDVLLRLPDVTQLKSCIVPPKRWLLLDTK
eukprot:2615314-Ditylum_brightwellii.AAC.1